MKIDYFKIIQDSAKFTWKYKILWIFGFLLAWFNGGGGSSTSSNYSDISDDTQISERIRKIAEKAEEVFSSPNIWLFIIVILVLLMTLILISWYLQRISKISIIKSVDLDRFGKQSYIRFFTLWKKSNSYILRFLALDLYKLYLIIPFIFLFILSSLAISFFKWVSIIMFILVIFVLVLVSVVVRIFWGVAERLIILNDINARESLKMSWSVLRKHYKEYFLAWLTLLFPSCIFSSFISILLLISVLPLAFIFIASSSPQNFSPLGILFAGCSCILLTIFLSFFEAPFQVFKVTYWTKFLMELKDKSFGNPIS